MNSVIIRASTKFIWIAPLARNRIRWVDSRAPSIFLQRDISDRELGEIVVRSLQESRNILSDEMKSLIEYSDTSEKEWQNFAQKQFEYKTLESLYRETLVLDIKDDSNTIRIEVLFNKDNAPVWVKKDVEDEAVVAIPRTLGEEEIGRTIKATINRWLKLHNDR